jgi:hypothetical protein
LLSLLVELPDFSDSIETVGFFLRIVPMGRIDLKNKGY